MDLKTIKARIREGQITSSAEFQRDVYLMFANSLMYNRPGSDIYTMAEEVCLALHDFFRELLTSSTDDVGKRGTNQHL
jgi:bromodomain-containing protein 8